MYNNNYRVSLYIPTQIRKYFKYFGAHFKSDFQLSIIDKLPKVVRFEKRPRKKQPKQ